MQSKDNINLLDYAMILIKWRWLIFLGTGLTVVVGILVSLMIPPVYTASVSFVPRGAIGERQELETLVGTIGTQWRNIRNVNEMVQYYSSAIKARPILEPILLTKFKSNKQHNTAPLIELLHIDGSTEQERIWKGVKTLRDLIKVGSGGGRIIRLSFTADEPQLAADVANAIIDRFSEWSKKVKQSEATLKIISDRLNAAKDQLAQKEQQLAELKKKVLDITSPDTEIKIDQLEREKRILESLVETLATEYSKAEIRRLQKESEHTLEIDIIEPATAPFEKSNLSRKAVAAISLVFGLFVTISLAFIIEFLIRFRQSHQTQPFWESLKKAKTDFILMGGVVLLCVIAIVIYYFSRS